MDSTEDRIRINPATIHPPAIDEFIEMILLTNEGRAFHFVRQPGETEASFLTRIQNPLRARVNRLTGEEN